MNSLKTMLFCFFWITIFCFVLFIKYKYCYFSVVAKANLI